MRPNPSFPLCRRVFQTKTVGRVPRHAVIEQNKTYESKMSSLTTIIGRPCIWHVFRPNESKTVSAARWAQSLSREVMNADVDTRQHVWRGNWTSECLPWVAGCAANRRTGCDANNGKTGRTWHQTPGTAWNDRETPHRGHFHYLLTSLR
jgi:hypothetical protein